MPGRPAPSWPSAQLTIRRNHSAVMVGVRNARAGARLGIAQRPRRGAMLGRNPSLVLRLGDALRAGTCGKLQQGATSVGYRASGEQRTVAAPPPPWLYHDADGERGVIGAGRV
jgi:hypothetical protein